MTPSLLDILRRRLILVGTIMTLLNAAFVAAYYGSDWDALRLEMVDRQIEAIVDATVVQDGKPRVELSDRARRMYEHYPHAYGFSVVHGSQAIAEANPELVRSQQDGPANADVSWHAGHGKVLSALHGTRRLSLAGSDVDVAFVAASDPAWLTFYVFLDEQVRHVLIPLVPFVILLTLVNIATVRSALAPVRQAADAALRISETLEPTPLASDRLPSEIAPLVAATNTALTRLSHALEAEKALTADAAHAFRTPLAVLNTRVANLSDGPEKSDLTRDVAVMRKLADQLLLAAQADRLEVSASSRCDLVSLAQEVVAAMAPMAIAQARSLALDASATNVWCVGDRDALAHALRNLIDNALKFAPDGSEVTVVVSDAPSISVLDRGPGIPDADKPHVFQRFWHRSAQGTGLGLAIVSRIAEAHGGTVAVSDRDGGGTVATLRLRR